MKRGIPILAGLAIVAFASFVAFQSATGQDKQAPPANAAGQNIDLALCLDVSNSMDGLIDAAKNKLWDIVNDLAKAKPAPNLRVALYSYGNDGYDKQKGWVRKELDFSTDLDMVFKKLFELRTNGGTELVARVCRDAIQDQKWSEGKNALKLIFVCGNEPASQDRTISLQELAKMAIAKDILINPIYCGNPDDPHARDWRELSTFAHGKFICIDQNQKVAVISTPFDKELADLGLKLNATYVQYGKEGKEKGENQKLQTENSAKLSLSNAASRTMSQNSTFYRSSGWDLVDKVKEDPKLDISKIPVAELCDEMKKMTPEQRVKHVADMAAKRLDVQKRVTDLTQQRDTYVREESRRQGKRGNTALDEALRGTIREQAKTKGIDIPE